jgi:hypothetical protein
MIDDPRRDYKYFMTPPEVPPKLVTDELTKPFRKLPAGIQVGIIDILRYRKCQDLFDDSSDRIPAALRYQDFLKSKPPMVIKDIKDIR